MQLNLRPVRVTDMETTAQAPETKKPPKKRQRMLRDRPIYFVVRKMADPETGEVVGCLVPDGWINRRIMRERKFRTNDIVRGTITNPRNVKFHRMVHQLGTLVRQNIEAFESAPDSHEVIKRLQRDAGVFCDTQEVDIPNLCKIKLQVPQSIAFDCMDESDFRQLWEGICQHLIAKYWPGLTVPQLTEMANLMPQNEGI